MKPIISLNHFKTIFLFIMMITSLLSSIVAHATEEKNENKEKPSYLYIQTAKYAELDYNEKSKNYTLTLYETDPWITFFTDAPDKKTDFTATENFTENFKKELSKHPDGLNIGLIAFEEDMKKPVHFTFSISDVVFDSKTNRAAYTATVIPGPQKDHLPIHEKLKHVALFIDSCASCGGGGF